MVVDYRNIFTKKIIISTRYNKIFLTFCKSIYLNYFFLSALIISEAININTIDPINAGKIGTPPHTGPQVPNNLLPIAEPTRPATILPMIPPGISLPTIAPAIQPIRPPTMIIIIKLICINSFLFVYFQTHEYYDNQHENTIPQLLYLRK